MKSSEALVQKVDSGCFFVNSLSIRTRYKQLVAESKKNSRRGINSKDAANTIFKELSEEGKMCFCIERRSGIFVVGFVVVLDKPNIRCQKQKCRTQIPGVFELKLEMMSICGQDIELVDKDQGFLIRIRDFLKERHPKCLGGKDWDRIHTLQNHLICVDTIVCPQCGFTPRSSRSRT